jgi:hypothetical protein
MKYKKFRTLTKNDKHEYMFATEASITNDVLRLKCPDVGGGNLGNPKNVGCRNSIALMSDPKFEPKAVIFYVGTVGSYNRMLYWVHRFDTEENGFYVRATAENSIPREHNRRNKKTNLYNTTIHLTKIDTHGMIVWEPPSLI